MKPAKIILAHLKRLGRSYKKLTGNFEEEEVHRFRVTMKRFRAFVRMLKQARHRRPLKIPKKIIALYHVTGEVRNLQLQRQRILHLSFKAGEIWPGSYLSFLENEEKTWKQKAATMGSGKGILKKGKKLASIVPSKLKKKHREAFAQQQAAAIRTILLLPQLKDQDLHRLRKILKDILYNWKYCGGCMVAVLPVCWCGESQIEEFTVALGNFQDLCLALELLAPTFIANAITPAETQTIETIKMQMEKEKCRVKQELCQKIAAINIGNLHFANQDALLK